MHTYICLKCKGEDVCDYSNAIIYCDKCRIPMETKEQYDALQLKAKDFLPSKKDREKVSWYVAMAMEKRFGRLPWMNHIANPFKLNRKPFNPKLYSE